MRLYKPQLRNNEIIVTIESGIVQVVVSGAVSKPAKLTFDRPTTVFQAIMEAGGVNEYGTLKKVRLIRTVNGEQLFHPSAAAPKSSTSPSVARSTSTSKRTASPASPMRIQSRFIQTQSSLASSAGEPIL